MATAGGLNARHCKLSYGAMVTTYENFESLSDPSSYQPGKLSANMAAYTSLTTKQRSKVRAKALAIALKHAAIAKHRRDHSKCLDSTRRDARDRKSSQQCLFQKGIEENPGEAHSPSQFPLFLEDQPEIVFDPVAQQANVQETLWTGYLDAAAEFWEAFDVADLLNGNPMDVEIFAPMVDLTTQGIEPNPGPRTCQEYLDQGKHPQGRCKFTPCLLSLSRECQAREEHSVCSALWFTVDGNRVPVCKFNPHKVEQFDMEAFTITVPKPVRAESSANMTQAISPDDLLEPAQRTVLPDSHARAGLGAQKRRGPVINDTVLQSSPAGRPSPPGKPAPENSPELTTASPARDVIDVLSSKDKLAAMLEQKFAHAKVSGAVVPSSVRFERLFRATKMVRSVTAAMQRPRSAGPLGGNSPTPSPSPPVTPPPPTGSGRWPTVIPADVTPSKPHVFPATILPPPADGPMVVLPTKSWYQRFVGWYFERFPGWAKEVSMETHAKPIIPNSTDVRATALRNASLLRTDCGPLPEGIQKSKASKACRTGSSSAVSEAPKPYTLHQVVVTTALCPFVQKWGPFCAAAINLGFSMALGLPLTTTLAATAQVAAIATKLLAERSTQCYTYPASLLSNVLLKCTTYDSMRLVGHSSIAHDAALNIPASSINSYVDDAYAVALKVRLGDFQLAPPHRWGLNH